MTEQSKPKFTSGPWRSFESGSDGARVLPGTGNPREGIRYTARVFGRDVLTDFANARLIAAAPELYAALRAMLTALENVVRQLPNDEDYQLDVAEAASWQAEAVLAKVEGLS